MNWLFTLSQEHLLLARAECKAIHPHCKEWKETSVLTCTGKTINPEKLAFTKTAHNIICQGTPTAIKEWAANNKRTTTKKIKVTHVNYSTKNTTGEAIRKIMIPWLNNPTVDLDNPEEVYAMIITDNEWFITRQVWENNEQFSKRANQHRPAPHPTSLPPKLARAMINLAGNVTTMLDPFCGSGGLLIEAELMNIQATGIDIDPVMITRAERNTKEFNTNPELLVGDARKSHKKTEAIITDVPYGMNSKADDLATLYKEFLEHAQRLTKKMVLGIPDLLDNEKLINKTGWKVQQRFVWVLHKNLKKEIYVLYI